jgi:hypothetical protein
MTSRPLPRFESYGTLESAAVCGLKGKVPIERFHGIGRLGVDAGTSYDCLSSRGTRAMLRFLGVVGIPLVAVVAWVVIVSSRSTPSTSERLAFPPPGRERRVELSGF